MLLQYNWQLQPHWLVKIRIRQDRDNTTTVILRSVREVGRTSWRIPLVKRPMKVVFFEWTSNLLQLVCEIVWNDQTRYRRLSIIRVSTEYIVYAIVLYLANFLSTTSWKRGLNRGVEWFAVSEVQLNRARYTACISEPTPCWNRFGLAAERSIP